MNSYRPQQPFNSPLFVFIPTATYVKGVLTKVYPETGEMIYCSFKTFGGTETTSNGSLVIEDTAVVETWYRPDLGADCKLKTADDREYEMLGTPENISMQNQFLKFKIRSVEGGA